ncbi:dephospho-CoA kinase [Leucobacter musarum]|uniref:dephospho-CoA kinase n=1 Tax=Leucobacter musarum TaxID=1930747 RepID=UPI0006A766B9|nr:dephospho-CoA kinase [Leucobacter musarum]
MQVIALTGGIAAGKSTIGKRLEELGATRIDADELARAAVAPGSPGLAAVIDRFGPQMLLADGSLDRAALGARVFGDPAALAALNAIVHPEVRRLFAERSRAAEAADASSIVVYEIPLLVETEAREGEWNQVVVAEADVETRVARMVHLRGMAEDDARRRIANQATDAERRALADHVIDTSGTEPETIAQVDRLWRRLTTSG